MNKKNVAIIGSQMDMGAVRKGVDMGPLAIRHAGLLEKISFWHWILWKPIHF